MAVCLASNDWAITDLSPVMRYGLSRKKCPYIQCFECLEDNEDNQQCYKDALELFKQ